MSRRVVVLVICAVATALSAQAQESQTSALPWQNWNFPTPVPVGELGVKAPDALNEVKAYTQAVSATGWKNLKGTGTVTFPAGDAHQASLYLSGEDDTRLDIEMESGIRSLRIHRFSGKFLDESKTQGTIPPMTAASGIVAYPRLWSDASTSTHISLLDDGMWTGPGHSLHRITMVYQVISKSAPARSPVTATDLYFDPSTHLLLFSVDSLTFNSTSGQRFLRVTGYGNYQSFSGLLIPTTVTQVLNGQLQWSLQLSQVKTNTNAVDSTFTF